MANNIIDSIRLSGTTYQIQGGSIAVDTELDSGSTNPVQNKVIYNKIDEVEEVTAAGLNALNDKINPTVELTQAEYEALTEKDPNTYYIITDASAGDLTQYWTSAQTNSAITAAVSGKQDTLISGTNIKTINNESILGSGNIDIQGGGKAVSGGTNISITTGETADTINCTLPIISGSNNKVMIGYNDQRYINNFVTKDYGVSIGFSNYVYGQRAVCLGSDNHADGYCSVSINRANSAMSECSFACGVYSKTSNKFEFASGQYNVSSSASTTFGDSGNTLFSVGNGTSNSARHNAFEIRQNGDIYLTKNGQDVKLQDQLGGSSITVDTSLDSGSTNPVENRVIYNKIDEVEQVTAAGLNALNDALGGLKLVKLTQAQYDALSPNYDSNTLYVIT